MNNASNRPPTSSFLIITTIVGLSVVMTLQTLTGAPSQTTAQQGYPAPATATNPAYPPPETSTATRSPATTTPVMPVSPTVPATATGAPITPTATPVVRPTLTAAPPPTRIPPTAPQFSQSAEVTPTMPGIVECAPGQTIIINGVAAPYAPLLLSFGPRIVSGGSARASGDFAIPLIMGMERAGEYQVTVRVRGTNQIVRSLTCRVPPTTPTSVPRRLR